MFRTNDGIRNVVRSRGLGDGYKGQLLDETLLEELATISGATAREAATRGVNARGAAIRGADTN